MTATGPDSTVYLRAGTSEVSLTYSTFSVARWIGFPSFTSGGATLDHEDPRVVYLSRRSGAFHQVEAWFTPDDGRTWRHTQLTAEPSHYCIRPVTPRALRGASLVLFSRGDRSTVGFTDFRTRIHALGGFSPPV